MKKGMVSVFSILAGVVIGAEAAVQITEKKVKEARAMSDKHLSLFLMMNQWVQIRQEGKNVADYMEKNHFHTIAIYGMSYAGERLLDELKNSDITVKYGIDRRAEELYPDIDVVSLEDNLDEVDAIIVTAVTFFDEIRKKLHEKVNCPVISLEDILYEI